MGRMVENRSRGASALLSLVKKLIKRILFTGIRPNANYLLASAIKKVANRDFMGRKIAYRGLDAIMVLHFLNLKVKI